MKRTSEHFKFLEFYTCYDFNIFWYGSGTDVRPVKSWIRADSAQHLPCSRQTAPYTMLSKNSVYGLLQACMYWLPENILLTRLKPVEFQWNLRSFLYCLYLHKYFFQAQLIELVDKFLKFLSHLKQQIPCLHKLVILLNVLIIRGLEF